MGGRVWEGKLGKEAPRGAFVGPARERADDQPAEGRNKEERERERGRRELEGAKIRLKQSRRG